MVNGDPEGRVWGPRVLAPLAFFTAATVLVLVVHRSLSADTHESSNPATATQPTATATGDRTITVDNAPRRRF
jgi:hypothetical protein